MSLIYIVTFKEAVGSNSNDQNKIIQMENWQVSTVTLMNLQDVVDQ